MASNFALGAVNARLIVGVLLRLVKLKWVHNDRSFYLHLAEKGILVSLLSVKMIGFNGNHLLSKTLLSLQLLFFVIDKRTSLWHRSKVVLLSHSAELHLTLNSFFDCLLYCLDIH